MTANEAIASFILHTSGTTGDSKWVKLTELQFLKAIRALAHAGGLHHAINQYTYLAPPLTHSYGLSAFLEYTFVGSAIALAPTLQPLSVLSGLTRKPLATEITALEGVPDFYRFLAKFSRKVDVPNLRHIGFGGGSVDLDAVSWLSERSSPLTCSIRYGLTETPSIVSHKVFILSCQRDHGATLEEYRLSSGKILPIYDVRIMNELGQLVPPEHEGEIFIQGDCLGLPYLGEMSTQTGHFATGDLGYLNAEEELVIVGRKSLFIKHKGFRISPEMVESAILSLETIVDCRVLIKNDELVAEMVRQDPNTSTQEVFQSIKSKLPSYALPTTLCWVEHLPRTLSGKLKRYEGA